MIDADWQTDLKCWLDPLLKGLGNKTRRRMCPAYIAGLIGPGDRKSIQPIAARASEISYDRLHHFIGAGVWDSAPLETALRKQADALVGGEKAWLIIDDTSMPKKGTSSVGVAPPYASTLGKQSKSKPSIAIEEIDRVAAAGVRFGCVLADAGYGLSASFRQPLSARGLRWAVGIPKHQKVYPADVHLVFPVAGRGRPRLRHVPDTKSIAAHTILENAKWRQVSWRRGTKGRLVARFAAMRVRVADGAPRRIGTAGAQHTPCEEACLVGEHRSNGVRKYYLSNLPVDTPIKEVAGAIKARWICEEAHQQLKEELRLDHFEGRSWTGLHRSYSTQ